MEAWQKLIRVITHEIMNSVTPISTLASTDQGAVPRIPPRAARPERREEEVRRDIAEAALTDREAQPGAAPFRRRLPQPDPSAQAEAAGLPLRELFDRRRPADESPYGRPEHPLLHRGRAGIPGTLYADPELVEQVLINLLLNALQAVEGRGTARDRDEGFLNERGRVLVQVWTTARGFPRRISKKSSSPSFPPSRPDRASA